MLLTYENIRFMIGFALGIGGVGVYIYVFIYLRRKFISRCQDVMDIYICIENILTLDGNSKEIITPIVTSGDTETEYNSVCVQAGPYGIIIHKGIEPNMVAEQYLIIVEDALRCSEDILWNTQETMYYKELLVELYVALSMKLWEDM